MSDSRPRVGIKSNKNKVAGIFKFTTSVSSLLGLTGITSWKDLTITKATLTARQHTSCPTGGYTGVVSTYTIPGSSSTNSENHLKNNGYYGSVSRTGSQGAGNNYVFDFTSIFQNMNDSKTYTPNSGTWYMYIYNSSYTSDYQFKKKSEYTSYFTIEARKKGGIGYTSDGSTWESCQVNYYVDSTTGWQECEVKYWDGTAWVAVGAP